MRGAGGLLHQHGIAAGQLEVQRHAGQVRTDHGNTDATGCRLVAGGLLWQRLAGGAQWQIDSLLPALSEGGQCLVMPGWGEQGDAGWQAVGAQPCRHGEGRQVGEVGEVGVGAELAVEQHGFGLHLGQGAQGRRGRHHHGVEAGQGVVDHAAQLGADVLGLVGIAGAVFVAVFDDAAHHRVDVFGVHTFHRDGAFGDPGAVVELLGQLLEGGEIDLHQLGAQFAQFAQCGLIDGLVLAVAEELGVGRYGQARIGRHADLGAVRVFAAVGIGGVIATGDVGHGQGIADGQGEHRDAIDRAAGRHQAGIGQPALGRLEPDDIVETRRYAARACGVGTEGEGRQTTGDHAGRTGAGTAADVIRVEAVRHRAVRRAGADQAGGELVEVGLADEDGAGGAQARDHASVGLGLVGELGAGGGGRPAGGVDIVLDGEGHAVQRQLVQIAGCTFQRACQGIELGIELRFAGQGDPGAVVSAQFQAQGVQQFSRGLAVAVGLLPLREGESDRCVGHASRFHLVSKLESLEQ